MQDNVIRLLDEGLKKEPRYKALDGMVFPGEPLPKVLLVAYGLWCEKKAKEPKTCVICQRGAPSHKCDDCGGFVHTKKPPKEECELCPHRKQQKKKKPNKK